MNVKIKLDFITIYFDVISAQIKNCLSSIFIIFVVYNECESIQILSRFYKGSRVSKKLTLSIESCRIYKDNYAIMRHK